MLTEISYNKEICAHTQSFIEVIPFVDDKTSPKHHRLFNKTPIPGIENVLSNCWSAEYKRTQIQASICCCR